MIEKAQSEQGREYSQGSQGQAGTSCCQTWNRVPTFEQGA